MDKETVSSWVSERIPGATPWTDKYEALWVEKDGKLVAGVIVDGYLPGVRCTIHCAGEGRWLTRGFIKSVFRYVFNQLGVRVVVNTVSSKNVASIRFTSHCGFSEACRIKGGSVEGDLVIFELQRDNCRWL